MKESEISEEDRKKADRAVEELASNSLSAYEDGSSSGDPENKKESETG
jgi:hypothetical protein